MISFDQQLRDLVDAWRAKGMSDQDIITTMQDEIASLNDLRSSRDGERS